MMRCLPYLLACGIVVATCALELFDRAGRRSEPAPECGPGPGRLPSPLRPEVEGGAFLLLPSGGST